VDWVDFGEVVVTVEEVVAMEEAEGVTVSY
jgi:hypothetical protein